VDYIGLIPVIVESIKEQQQMIDVQSEKIRELEIALAALQGNSVLRSSADATGISALSKPSTQCVLTQNAPNPFTNQTEIKYFIANEVKDAYICIFDMQGKMLQKITAASGQNSVTIQGSTLTAGMYLYSLVADGQEVDTKRMILTK
jgi:2-C-methyl-D-erythritol 4-phosphate cytidylyltransferase